MAAILVHEILRLELGIVACVRALSVDQRFSEAKTLKIINATDITPLYSELYCIWETLAVL